MRILFFHRWVGVHDGGTERHIKELASFLFKRDHDVSILTRSGALVNELKEIATVYTVSKNYFESDFSFEDFRVYIHTLLFVFKALCRLFLLHLSGRKFDIISVHFVTESLVAQIFRFFTRTPYLFVMEGYTDLEARFARKANVCMASSQHEVDECYKNYGFKPVLKPHSIDVAGFSGRIKSSQVKNEIFGKGKRILLSVCRLEPRKDLVTLLEAMRILKNSGFSDMQAVIVGEGIQGDFLKNKCRQMGLGDMVRFAGRVSDDDLPSYYSSADIFVLPTLYEGFGIVYLEAMAVGLPIVSTLVGAVPEVVDGAGILIEHKNPGLLAKKIEELLSDKILYDELAKRSLRRATDFESNKILPIFEECINNFLKGHNHN